MGEPGSIKHVLLTMLAACLVALPVLELAELAGAGFEVSVWLAFAAGMAVGGFALREVIFAPGPKQGAPPWEPPARPPRPRR